MRPLHCLLPLLAACRIAAQVNSADLAADSLVLQTVLVQAQAAPQAAFAAARAEAIGPIAASERSLSALAGVAFRQNGSGGITTLRTQGVSSSRTGLLWLGLDVADPQLGAGDIGQLQPFLNTITIASTTASPAVTANPASLQLHPPQLETTPLQVALAYAQGGEATAAASVATAKSATRVLLQHDRFRFAHSDGDRVLADARGAQRLSIGATNASQLPHLFGAKAQVHSYLSHTDRVLPRNSFDALAAATLSSTAARAIVNLTRGTHSFQAGALANSSDYEDVDRDISSQGRTLQGLLTASGKALSSHALTYRLETRVVDSRHTAYSKTAQYLRLAGQLDYHHPLDQRHTLALHAGALSQTGQGLLPHGSLILTGEHKLHHYQIGLRRLARFPLLDDLFWAQGGDVVLGAETGWALEASTEQQLGEGASVELTGYARQLRDYILWLPGIPFWSPSNAGTVNSAGATLSTHYQQSLAGLQLHAHANLGFAQAYARDLHTALPFNPTWLHRAELLLQYKRLSMGAQQSFTGRQLTGFDESLQMPAYWTHDLSLGYQCHQLLITVTAENLFNTPIPNADLYPTPLRRLGLQLTYTR